MMLVDNYLSVEGMENKINIVVYMELKLCQCQTKSVWRSYQEFDVPYDLVTDLSLREMYSLSWMAGWGEYFSWEELEDSWLQG